MSSLLPYRCRSLVSLGLTVVLGFAFVGASLAETQSERLSKEKLVAGFAEPGADYRGKPFWSWNGELKKDELLRQAKVLKEMGMGGYFMHSRTGLATEYLGKEWFDLINICADEGEKLGLSAWLYDEDRWPSGTAGGMVTQDPKYRTRYMHLKVVPAEQFSWNDGIFAAFSCKLKGLAYTDCKRIAKDTPAAAYQGKTILVFSIRQMPESSFYNGCTYLDTMNREATERFIQVTHEQYKARCGNRLGRSIKGIFTDEPHRGAAMCGFGIDSPDGPWMTPWTEALPARFQEAFGYDLVERLPELFLQKDGQAVSPVKWHYMELTQRLFLENFAKPIYDWCERNGMLATGHVLHEDALTCQACMQGSMMRFYEYLHCPGVDVLTEGNRNYWIVKQLASASRQLGRTWLLSELYGCTGWQMSFESHKAVGDWQALFGINLRCHHLCWYTMEGEAKRDYPASIFYQSAWWKDYQPVETYYARLGFILNQGKPCCDVLVLNPVESTWCQIHAGWAQGLSSPNPDIVKLEKGYSELFHWLAGSQIDFDYGDEEMIGRLYRVDANAEGGPVLWIGQAPYRAVVVPRMTTIRSTTLKLLKEFLQAGGKVVFLGDSPAFVDAAKSAAASELAARSIRLPWNRDRLVRELNQAIHGRVEIVDRAGKHLDEVFCQMRDDGARRYLVAMNTNPEKAVSSAVVRVRGKGHVTEWDCFTGKRYSIPVQSEDGWLQFTTEFAPTGEHVYVIDQQEEPGLAAKPVFKEKARQVCQGPFEYTLGEKNVCVLDLARYQIGDQAVQPETEVLKVDQAVRRAYNVPLRSGEMVQPWYSKKYGPKAEVKGSVKLLFDFAVEQRPEGPVWLCVERPETVALKLNGQALPSSANDGWWVDPIFTKLPLPADGLKVGQNTVELSVNFSGATNLEALYLVGDFGVRLDGSKKTLVRLPEKLAVGDVAAQNLPFYSGAITYKVPLSAKPAAGEQVLLEVPKFEGACVKVCSAGHDPRMIAWQPYQTEITDDARNRSAIDVQVVLTRRNTFGPLHQVPLRSSAYGPGNFVTEGPGFSQSYLLYPAGLLQPPVVRSGSYY